VTFLAHFECFKGQNRDSPNRGFDEKPRYRSDSTGDATPTCLNLPLSLIMHDWSIALRKQQKQINTLLCAKASKTTLDPR